MFFWGQTKCFLLPYFSRFFLLFYFCMWQLYLRDACKLDCFLKHWQLMENLKYTEKQTMFLIYILKMNCKWSTQFCSFYLDKLSVDHSCPYKVIMMQSKSLAKMLFSGIWQVFQPAVFCRVFNTMHSLMYTSWSSILLSWEDCICYAVTITQAQCFLTTQSCCVHYSTEMLEKWSSYNTVHFWKIVYFENVFCTCMKK